MTHLRNIMLEELERRNLAETTKQCYIQAVEEFAQYFKRPPDQLGPEHIREFQAHLFTHGKMAPNTVNQRLAALRFFFVKTLNRPWNAAETPYPKKVIHLPVVLSREDQMWTSTEGVGKSECPQILSALIQPDKVHIFRISQEISQVCHVFRKTHHGKRFGRERIDLKPVLDRPAGHWLISPIGLLEPISHHKNPQPLWSIKFGGQATQLRNPIRRFPPAIQELRSLSPEFSSHVRLRSATSPA